MVPNVIPVDVQAATITVPSIADNFWACDRRGMDQLKNYMRSCYDTLDNVQALYKGRAELEEEFGQKLMALHKRHALAERDDGSSATQRVVSTLYQELSKSAQSHMDMSGRLKNDVAPQLGSWIKERRANLDQLIQSLDGLYKERQEKLSMVLRIPDYQKRHDEYISAVTVANQLVDEWNTTWKNACEEIESLEQERAEFFFNNVWEYANLASARLLVQDEWCETIRTRLEEYNVQDDIIYCVEKFGTGAKEPTTSEYVDSFAEKSVNKELPPRPAKMGNAGLHTQRSSPEHGDHPSVRSTMNTKRKPLGGKSKDATLNALLKKFEQPQSTTKQPESHRYHHPPVPSVVGRPEISKKPHHNLPPLTIKPPKSPIPRSLELTHDITPSPNQQQEQNPPRSPAIPKADVTSRSPNTTQQQQQQPSRSPVIRKTDTVPRSSDVQRQSSTYRQQQQQQQQYQPPRSPALTAGGVASRGPYQEPQCHQTPPRSPMIPAADLIPPSSVVQQNHSGIPATADTAPRSPIQQHQSVWSSATPTTPVDAAYQQQRSQNTYQLATTAQQGPASAEYAPRSPIQGYAAAPPRSPVVSPHYSVGGGGYDVSQQRSPVMQQTSASMAPRSPVTQHHAPMTPADMYPRSPTVPPDTGYADYGSNQPRWPPPPPATHYSAATQQHPYPPTYWSALPTVPYELQDGRQIQFWARAIYDRIAEDSLELSFQRGNLFAVMGESRYPGWWDAVLWDETWQTGQGSGCIPGNYVRRV
ncbi:hypothetical protein BX666DRAFT_1980551 [Dichotomocladium elegans]|nr:hypothetical protein BX666DRAFT_1980551 [Dichotomocladium elegans]